MKDNDAILLSDSEPENNITTENNNQHPPPSSEQLQTPKEEKETNDSSSSESLVEIRLNEFTKRSELSSMDIRAIVVKCSSCGRQINHLLDKEVKKHRRLGVITCKECYEFYGSSEFSQDESGYNYCTWCGNGGKLIVCDFCPNGFCSSCVRRNFGRSEISETNKEGWKCYCCNRKRLKPKINFCDMIMKNKSNLLVKDKKSILQATIPTFHEKWLQTAFDESEKLSKLFLKKLTKLKSVGKKKSKSLKHIVSKLEQVIENHRTELNKTVECLSKEYRTYNDLRINEQNGDDDVIEIHDVQEPKSPVIHENGTVNQSPSPIDNLDKRTMNELDNIDELKDVDKPGDVTASHEKQNDISQKLKLEAKLLLLQSSSDSDAHGEESVLQKNSPETDVISNKNSTSPDTTKEKENSLLSSKAKTSLLFSDDSSDSYEKKESHSLIDFLPKIEVDIETDPKLKLETVINLISCDYLLPSGETSLKIVCTDDDEEEKLEKLIDQLCKFPSTRRKNENAPTKKSKSNMTAAKKKKEVESSSSISLSSSEDERLLKAKTVKTDLKSAKPQLSNSSSCNITSDSEIEDENKKSKKSKAKPKEENSSDDFQPKKKKKYDKLLNERINSTDDEKKTKTKTKKANRKKRILSSGEENKSKKDSDKLSDSTDSSDEEARKNSRKQAKKRRRIQTLGSSSEEDQSKNVPGKGRKNINKIISQKKLADSTIEAQMEEKERRKRIQERQKLYNKIEDISNDGKVVITKKMVLEVDQESKEEIVEIHPDLVCKLKPHQVNGVKFMWECNIESVKDLKKPGSGCILAHCMGLGKTLQVIAFLHTCLNNKYVNKVITKAMIICPYNTALNWATEFDHWLSDVEGDIRVHQLATCKSNLDRADILNYWFEEGGVIIVSYDIFRRLAADKITKVRTAQRLRIHKCLLDPGPDIVVCDEGHVLKNESSAIFKATTKLKTSRRIVLTGTPLQNNLKEYHCMLTFVKPNLLGNIKEFRNRFVNPIINGQYDDSNEYDVKLMKKRIHILHKLLEGCVQRCDYSALTKFLPPKHEFVISVKLSEIQMNMYECYLEKFTNAKTNIKSAGGTLFSDFNNLRCIWNHPYMCIKSHERAEYKKLFRDESEEEFINDDSESSKDLTSSDSGSKSEELIDLESNKTYRTRSKVKDGDEKSEEETKEEEGEKQWYNEFISDADKCNIELSGKMVLLIDILKECEAIGDKIILFSQSLLALDAIEEILNFLSVQPLTEADKDRDSSGQWVKGLDYFRMDGTTSADFRKNYIDMFNDPRNLRSRLFLISTRAGSLGTNLIGANRVVVFDTSWNPSHDVQAIFRVYRFGQTKPVYIYRLLAQGTMEEKIYDRQVTKLSLSCRVIDEQQIDRHFSAAVLADLYTFDRNSTSNRPTPMVPKDRLLAELLIRNKDWIVTYHEHDSLLQNQTEEDLTEDERQAAWTEYENEREGRSQASSLTEEDLNTLGREPDFNNVTDYEGKMIPELRVIISNLYERLRKEMPANVNTLEFKRKLLAAVYRVRQAFQEKHVKILRIKQEFVAQGVSVPNALNKYIDELSQALKSTGDYVMKLQGVINQESAAKLQEHLRQMQQTMRNSSQTQMPGINPQMATRFVFSGRMPTTFPNFRQTGQRVFYTARHLPTQVRIPYPVNQSMSKPTITEVDDNAPPEPATQQNTSNNKSTVIIQEIT